MIVKNDELQCLECTDCGEVLELSRKVHGAPETVFLLKEQMQQDHSNCAALRVIYGDHTKVVQQAEKRAAVRSAEFDRRVRVEMAKLPKAG